MSQEIRVRVVTAFVLLLVFGAGFSVGLVVDEPWAETAAAADASNDEAKKESDGRSTHERIIDRIDLTADQRAEVDSLVGYYHTRMIEFQREYRPKYWEIVDSSRAAIARVMEPDQAAVYDSLLAQSDRRRGRRNN